MRVLNRYTLEFQESQGPISGPVTKFGGRPSWLSAPTWPLSRSTGEPMRFIGQVALERENAGDVSAKMAYLFITDPLDGYVDGTWEPYGGENAVVVQPGPAPELSAPLEAGPTLYRMVPGATPGLLEPRSCEFAVTLNQEDESESLEGNKIGGSPAFIQGPEYPDESGYWMLLLQLDSTDVPFYVNFGDAGIGYVFLSEDGQRAAFLWQCA